MLRAAKVGVPTLPNLVTDSVKKIISELGFPVILFAVNPFIYDGFKIAQNKSALYRCMKSLGMNYKFAVCAQPLKGELLTVKSFFGKVANADPETEAIAQKVYEILKIPVWQASHTKPVDKAYLCGLQPLKKKKAPEQGLANNIQRGTCPFLTKGEHFGVQDRVLC